MRCWCGHLSGARCRLFAYGPVDATASPNPIISFKSRMVSPFWSRLTQVVMEKRPLNGCSSSRCPGGRQQHMWKQTVDKHLATMPLTFKEAEATASDKQKWRPLPCALHKNLRGCGMVNVSRKVQMIRTHCNLCITATPLIHYKSELFTSLVTTTTTTTTKTLLLLCCCSLVTGHLNDFVQNNILTIKMYTLPFTQWLE